ncbi:MAG: tetratricopeptide repeat protein [Candidatus Thorarchaeota archaeon]
MKPLGTITKYYPFLDSETRDALEALREESENFNDFLIRLGERVCSEDVPLHLAFMGAIWAWHGEGDGIKERIAEKYGDFPVIVPWTFSGLISAATKTGQESLTDALDKAIRSQPEDWILCLTLLRKIALFIAMPEGSRALDAAKKLLEKGPKLECFRPEILRVEARIKDHEGDKKGAIEIYLEVLKRARQQNDMYLVASVLRTLASKTALTDFHKAMQFIDEAYSISEELGLSGQLRSTLGFMSHISHKLGEYDLALKCLFNAWERIQSPRGADHHIPIDVSDIHSDLEDGKEALNWALMYSAEEDSDGPQKQSRHGCPEFAMARALLLMDRTDEALDHIHRLQDIAIKTGWEPWLAGHYHVSGLYEMAVGETANGMQMIEKAVEIGRRLSIQTYVNRCLIDLTKAEIELYEIDTDDLDPRDSGPWMRELEKEASDKQLTGILIQHALLKAEFRLKLKQTEAARETLEAALDISDQPSVKTLRGRILKQLDNLSSGVRVQ